MDRKPTTSDLLALRDGELGDAELAADIYADAGLRAQLANLTRLKSDLRALPTAQPDPAVWAAIEQRIERKPSWLQRFPLATAASVFLATALTIMLWDPATTGPMDSGPQVSDPVAGLMLRSQRLESELFTRAAAPAIPAGTGEQALVYGIADVDAQLNALYAAADIDPEKRERLWRQRVMLLESLADVQRGQAMLRPAIY